MLVKMKADISGSRDGKPWPRPGFTLDVPDWEARELIDQGMAELAPAVAPVEAAVVSTEPASVTVSAGVTKASMQAATVPTRPAPVPKG